MSAPDRGKKLSSPKRRRRTYESRRSSLRTSTTALDTLAGSYLLSHRVTPAVPSACKCLTTVFGMGTGGTTWLSPPAKKAAHRNVVTLQERPDARGQAERTISTGQLSTLLYLHLRPINLVVFEGPSGRAHLEGGFPLRCFQRLSRPYVATRQCRWRDNRYTIGTSIPVLSY